MGEHWSSLRTKMWRMPMRQLSARCKEMENGKERELEIIRNGLTYVKADAQINEPHWDTKYSWTEDPISLTNNKSGVQDTLLRTEKQLKKEPEWKRVYAAQVYEMVERRAAMKLTKEIIASWKGPVWLVSHLVAPNPHSVTTPVHLVWNSSQKFKTLLLKGPIRALLLRFRRGVHAVLGDIKKMYVSLRLEDLLMHLQISLERHPEWRNRRVRYHQSQYWRSTSRVHCSAGHERDSKIAHICWLGGGT